MKLSHKTLYLGIILLSSLLAGMGSCGIFELFGERDSNPTTPCIELVPTQHAPTPTPTPTPKLTPTPRPTPEPTAQSTSTPMPRPTPTPTIIPTPTPHIQPTPTPSTEYIISATQSYSITCLGGNMSPLGTVLVSGGANQSFQITITGSVH